MSVSVLLFLSVKDIVDSLIDSVWNIVIVSLVVATVLGSCDVLVPGDGVIVELDLIVGGVSLFFVRVVLCLRLFVNIGDWDLSGSDFVIKFMVDCVLNLLILDWDVTESVGFAM